MKKKLILLCFLICSMVVSAQEMTMSKAQTITFISDQYKLCEDQVQPAYAEPVLIKDCSVSFKRGFLIFSHSEMDNKKNRDKYDFQFSPLDIDAIRNVTLPGKKLNDNDLGYLDIYFKSAVCMYTTESFNPHEISTGLQELQHLDYYIEDGKGYSKIEQALLHLQKLMQQETDPYEFTGDEKRLSAIFAKYKTYEGGSRPNGSYAGSKVTGENMALNLYGPRATYSLVKTTTDLRKYDDEDEHNQTTKLSLFSEFFWKEVTGIKYNVVAGALFIKGGGDKGFTGVIDDLIKGTHLKTKNGPAILFKTAANDQSGATRADVMEVISLIKRIVKDYGGGEVSVEINEL